MRIILICNGNKNDSYFYFYPSCFIHRGCADCTAQQKYCALRDTTAYEASSACRTTFPLYRIVRTILENEALISGINHVAFTTT